jgi:hypothetical protein
MAGDTKAVLAGAVQQFRDVQRDAVEASLADLPTDLIDSARSMALLPKSLRNGKRFSASVLP